MDFDNVVKLSREDLSKMVRGELFDHSEFDPFTERNLIVSGAIGRRFRKDGKIDLYVCNFDPKKVPLNLSSEDRKLVEKIKELCEK